MPDLIGWTLVAGMVVFLVGAAAWNLAYERPLREAMEVIHGERRRRAWIHLWMIPALFITSAGLAALPLALETDTSRVLGAMAATVYGLGAVCWIASLLFRLTVVPWAAEQTVVEGDLPAGFQALDAWAGSLYVAHMASAYVSFALLGGAVLTGELLPAWLGWIGVGMGVAFAAGFVATRFSGLFNPPFWAHTFTAAVGVGLLLL